MESRTQESWEIHHTDKVRFDISTGYSLQKKPKQRRYTSHLWMCLLPEKWVCGTLWCLTTALVSWIPLIYSILSKSQRENYKDWTQTSVHHPWQLPKPEQFQPSQKVACALDNNSIKQNKFKTNTWRWNMWFFFPECSSIYFTEMCRSVYKNLDFSKTSYFLTCHGAMSMLSWNNN